MTSRFKLRHELVCSILVVITHAYKYSWQLKLHYFAEGGGSTSILPSLHAHTHTPVCVCVCVCV